MRFVALAATTMAVMSLLTVGSATRAQADQATLAWSHHLTQLEPTSLISQLDGNITVAQCNANPSSSALAVKDYHQSGSLVWAGREIPNNANPRPNICPHNGESVVDKTGALYTIAQTPPQYRTQLAAYTGSVQKWIISTLPHSCQSLTKLTVGTNGNIYALLTRCGSWAQESYLFGVTPGVLPGNTAPSTVLDIQLSSTPVGHGLAAYSNGLVVQYASGIQYYNYNGNTSGPQSVNGLGYTWQLLATLDGRVFLPIRAANTTGCPSPNGATAEKITAFEASGLQWTYSSLPACADVHDLRPNYHGGVVAHAVVNNGTINEQRFMNIDRNGQPLWTVPYLTPGTTFHPGWTTTLNGDIALQGMYKQNNHYGVKFMLLSGVTGETLFVNDFYSATDGYYPVNQSTDITIAKNRAYLSLSKCPGGWPCGAEPTLYALNVPGLEIDYPRGAILRYDEPWKDLVVPGDSFSSAEGVEPFLPGTDTPAPNKNVCHRSEKAYAKLLDGNPAKRLRLQAFVACSGAKTDQITGQWPADVDDPVNRNEAPQVNAINSSTNAVILTVGGNDARFAEIVKKCLFLDCGSPTVNQQFFDTVSNLDNKLRLAYDAILAKAPQATVYVVGYPQLFPEPSRCPDPLDGGVRVLDEIVKLAHNGDAPARLAVYLVGRSAKLSDQQIETVIQAGRITFTGTEIDVARRLTSALNDKIKQVVNSKQSPRLRFIDTVESSFTGHELCTSDAYFNGLDLVHPEYSFHPKNKGQDAYRRLILAYL